MPPKKAFVVGAGRLGCGLLKLLPSAGLEVLGAWSRSATSARRARRITGMKVSSGRPPSAISHADWVFLPVADQAVSAVCAGLVREGLVGKGQAVVHCSGCLDLSPLSAAAEAGAEIGSLHVLRSFADPKTAHELFSGALALIDGNQAMVRRLSRLARALGSKPVSLSPRPGVSASDARALYHAAAVLSAGGLVALLDTAAQTAEAAGLERGAALEGLVGLARSTLNNLARSGSPAKAMTGPVARGDEDVIRRHLEALEGVSPEARLLYRTLNDRAALVVSGKQ